MDSQIAPGLRIKNDARRGLPVVRDARRGLPDVRDARRGLPGVRDARRDLPVVWDAWRGLPVVWDARRGLPVVQEARRGFPHVRDARRGVPAPQSISYLIILFRQFDGRRFGRGGCGGRFHRSTMAQKRARRVEKSLLSRSFATSENEAKRLPRIAIVLEVTGVCTYSCIGKDTT